MRKLGSRPRLCWPRLTCPHRQTAWTGIKRQPIGNPLGPRHRQSWTGGLRVRFRTKRPRAITKTLKTLPFPLRCPAGMSKRSWPSSPSVCIVRTRKGVPTNWPARPMDLTRPLRPACQALFGARRGPEEPTSAGPHRGDMGGGCFEMPPWKSAWRSAWRSAEVDLKAGAERLDASAECRGSRRVPVSDQTLRRLAATPLTLSVHLRDGFGQIDQVAAGASAVDFAERGNQPDGISHLR